jgi:uncharacterized protein (TIGR02453 family)
VTATEAFVGFPAAGLAFLRQLPTRDRAWFAANRPDYERTVLDPAKAFAADVGARLRLDISPAIVVQPRVNGAIAPINRDLRFSKDKTLYKDHLLFRWWEGGEKHAAPTLFVRLSAEQIGFATGVAFASPVRWRQQVAGARSGAVLAEAIETLRGRKPIEIAGDELKRPPSPWTTDHPRGGLLRHKTMFQVRWTEPTPPAITSAEFTEWCAERLQLCAAIHRWLVEHLAA